MKNKSERTLALALLLWLITYVVVGVLTFPSIEIIHPVYLCFVIFAPPIFVILGATATKLVKVILGYEDTI